MSRAHAHGALRSVSDGGDRVTVTDQVSGITPHGFFLGHSSPRWSRDVDVFIPRSQILDSDTDLDEIETGEEVTFEIPRWLAREKGLVE